MLFLEELDDLRLYSARRKMYIPIAPASRKKGAAIMLLSKNSVDSHTMMNLPYIYNPKLYESLYIDRNVNALIDTGAIIDEKDEELAVNEAMQHDIANTNTFKIDIECNTGSINDIKLLKAVYNEKNFIKWYKFFKTSERRICRQIKIKAYPVLKDAVGKHQMDAMKNRDVISRSYSYDNTIVVVANSGYKSLEKTDGEYSKYLLNELITFVAMKTSKNCTRAIANHIGTALSGQINDKVYSKISDDYGNVTDYGLVTAYMVKKLYDEQGRNAIIKLCHSGDYSILGKYTTMAIIKNIKGMYSESTNEVFIETEDDKMRSTLERILALNKELTSYDYGFKVNGKKETDWKKYRVCSPAEFEKHRCGVCWDFAIYQAYYFKKNFPNIKFKTWYVVFDNNHDCPTHTFTTFKISHNKYGYFESAFGDTTGVWVSPSENDIINFVMHKMVEHDKREIALDTFPHYCIEFNASDTSLIGMDTSQFMQYMSKKLGNNPRQYPYSTNYKIEKLDLNKVFNENFNEYTNSTDLYYDLMKVFDTFSDEEKGRVGLNGEYPDYPNNVQGQVGLNGEYPDPPINIHRSIKRDELGNPIGFIDAYKFNNRPHEAQLVVGLDPDHRGKGYMRNMLGDYINHSVDGYPGITRFVWFTDPKNDKSVKLATSCGFKKNGKHRYRDDLGIYEDMYEYEIPFKENTMRVNLPVDYLSESVQSGGYTMTEDYIMTDNFITFFNGMDTQIISEAEKKYDSKLKRYLFKERLKNNKAVLMRYEELKVMNPWIKKTFLKLSQYQKRNLFIDMSFYHALFLKNLQFSKDAAIKMYWDFINRLINDSEYKTLYPKMTIFIPVWADAWDVKNAEELMDYKQSINPISLIIRMLRKNPNDLKKWGNKDILFVGPMGYFKLNFSKFEVKDLTKFRRFIAKLVNNEDIENDENEDGYTTSKEVDSTAVITANVIDKIEKGTGIKIDDITGGAENPNKPEDLKVLKPSMNFTHLRVRAEEIKLPKESYDEKGIKNAVLILAPDEESAANGFIENPFDHSFFGKRGFYSP